jgi:hypothetical protein
MPKDIGLIETTISGDTVRVLYADAPTKEGSSEFVELSLKIPGDGNRRIGVVHRAALRRLRALIDEEDGRLKALADQIP